MIGHLARKLCAKRVLTENSTIKMACVIVQRGLGNGAAQPFRGRVGRGCLTEVQQRQIIRQRQPLQPSARLHDGGHECVHGAGVLSRRSLLNRGAAGLGHNSDDALCDRGSFRPGVGQGRAYSAASGRDLQGHKRASGDFSTHGRADWGRAMKKGAPDCFGARLCGLALGSISRCRGKARRIAAPCPTGRRSRCPG